MKIQFVYSKILERKLKIVKKKDKLFLVYIILAQSYGMMYMYWSGKEYGTPYSVCMHITGPST